jgi:hypothetical protein
VKFMTPMRAVVALLVLTLIVGGGNLWSGYAEAHSQARAVLAAEQHAQAEQQAAGAALERKLCTTFGKLAANRPPAGNPATNPSRAYDQNQHAILDQLGDDLGCK